MCRVSGGRGGPSNLSVSAFQPAQNPQMTKPQTPPTLSYPPDTVEISAENKIKAQTKEKMSTGAKVGLTALGVVGGIALGAVCFAKHQTGKLTKLYNEKMQLLDLPKHIDFKEAKTVEEGIKFAKDVLKIGEVDSNFTLEAINYANKGLVEVSNANKGHLFMPKKMVFKKTGRALAYVENDVKASNFAELGINSDYFNDKFVNEKLNNVLTLDNGKKLFEFIDGSKVKTYAFKKSGIRMGLSDETKALLKKFYNNPEQLNIVEKRKLLFSMQSSMDELRGQLYRFPLSSIKQYKTLFEKNLKINIDIESLAKKTTKEQSEVLEAYALKMANIHQPLGKEIKLISPENQIYHEMGHLQDFAKNLKELDLQYWQVPSFKEVYRTAKEGKRFNIPLNPVGNRWGGLTYDGYKELLEKNPTKFKKRYPDLYEHLTNQEIRQTAGKVSWYAPTSIGEFIAEVYAKMVRGDKIPDDVMELYKKYNGPTIPFS